LRKMRLTNSLSLARTVSRTVYQERYEVLVRRFDTAKNRFEETLEKVSDRQSHRKAMEAFIADFGAQDGLIADFDDRLWFSLLDYATVYCAEDVRFTFKDGTEIRA